jgi:hypothetical protein
MSFVIPNNSFETDATKKAAPLNSTVIAPREAWRILQGEYEVKRPLSSEVKILATSIALLDV